MTYLTESALALQDIKLGWQLREGWWSLSKQSILISYRRTTLGPMWITVQQAIFIGTISLVYPKLFKVKASDLVPLISLGTCFWSLISASISGASYSLTKQSQAIKSSTLPLSFYIYLFVAQQFLTFLHSGIALVLFTFLLKTTPLFACVLTIPLSITIALINGFAFGLWLGPLSSRFRDISPSMQIVTQFLMFLTPIFWSKELLGKNDWIIQVNPFAWMIETFRSPLLGDEIHLDLWSRLIIFTFTNLVFGLMVFKSTRGKIAYWI